MSDRVLFDVADGVAHVRMNRADKRNALDLEMFDALAATAEELGRRSDVRVVVLSGDGASFCAGLDLSAFAEMSGGSKTPGRLTEVVAGRITHRAQYTCWAWQELAVPVIAALHGHALGGGIQLALAADIRIAHPQTQLSVREVYWGLIPDMTGTLTLSRLVRPDVAKELVMTARIFDGAEALRLGMVTQLADDPIAVARDLAAMIAERSPDAIRATKELFNGILHHDAATAFANERRLIHQLIGTPNQAEAVTAHFERRPPRFADR